MFVLWCVVGGGELGSVGGARVDLGEGVSWCVFVCRRVVGAVAKGLGCFVRGSSAAGMEEERVLRAGN